MTVYRYMQIEEFLNLIVNNKLILKYPGNWPDSLEDLFNKSFTNEECCNNLIDCYSRKYNISIEDVKSDLAIISNLLLKSRCQCWSFDGNNQNLWEINNIRKIRVCVENDSLKKLNLCCDKVSYLDVIDISTLIDAFYSSNRNPFSMLFLKSKDYSDEFEFRIVKYPKNHFGSYYLCGESLTKALINNWVSLKESIGVEPIEIDYDKRNIKSVMVNPKADDAFATLVKEKCRDYLSNDVFVTK